METTQIATEVSTPEKSGLNEFQLAAIEAAEKELADLKKDLVGKKYLLDLDKADISNLTSFIMNDAPWKFTESLGIIEVEKELKKSLKDGKLFTTGIAIEAIYYYLSKVEGTGKNVNGTGFKTVEEFLKVLKAINNGLEKIKVDNDAINQAEFVAAARREGIEPSITEEATEEA